ncbi:TPA: nucleotide exchange factor GrpE [Candidatus Spyradomonas excrementavium]|nr:nucleotide exchange factor GrpE [Candidatus Spyradomonas excrementavium]
MGNAENENIENMDDLNVKNNPFAKNESETEQETDETAAEETVASEIDSLKEQLEKVNNQYIRLAADFDNYRKRQMQERESLLKYGAEDTLKKMIEALDNIDRAIAAAEKSEDVNQVKDSYKLGFKQLYDVLQKIGMEVIDTKDTPFDPNFHEAVMQTPTDEHPEHTIIAELQKGYKLGDRVLRPALVNVAVKPE